MDLDEAIRYYSHLADECRRKVNIERYDYMDLKDLAAEHGQLADWLNELKVLREKIQKLLDKQEQDRWIPCKERLPEYKEKVLVSYDTEDGKKVDISMFDRYGCLLGIVDAWRPLPEQYTEEEA